MANVTINLLYDELRQMHKELHELRARVVPIIPEEEISEAERKELRSLFKEIESGKGKPWREAFKE